MRFLVLFTLFFSFSSCATIVSDSDYSVAVNSSPSGARFEVKNRTGMPIQQGTTPSVVYLPASNGFLDGASYSITVSKDGYHDGAIYLGSSIDPWVFGNIFLGFLPFVIDGATGAMYKLPAGVHVQLSEQ